MKVGIITYHNAYSFGAQLQAYALQEVIQSLGHEAWIINYKGVGFDVPRIRDLKGILRCPWNFRNILNRYVQKKRFMEFAVHQHLTDYYGSYDELMENPPIFDAYVCGSDQVWQPKDLKDARTFQDEFFLSFVRNGGRLIAYAPSFGTIPDHKFIEAIAPCLKRFDHISVREESMIDIVRNATGKDCTMVCDPTILLGRSGFEKLLSRRTEGCCGAFFYPLTLNLPRDKDICVQCAARFGKLEIVSRNRSLDGIGCNAIPSPVEWLQKIRDSEFVLTNSFHGTVFSVLFHKRFVTLNWSRDLQNIRVRNLLSRLGLTDRFYEGANAGAFMTFVNRKIDWVSVDERIIGWRELSMAYLKKALER